MLGKRQNSVIGKLSELLVSGSRGGAGALFDLSSTSPRRGPHSPRSPKNYDLGGVGLGIVAALERSTGDDVFRPRVSRTGPTRSRDRFYDDDSENYSYVTCYGPNCQSFTKVYYDGGDFCCGGVTESRPSHEECRSMQITMDERRERCRSNALRAVHFSTSPYTEGQIFSMPILGMKISCLTYSVIVSTLII